VSSRSRSRFVGVSGRIQESSAHDVVHFRSLGLHFQSRIGYLAARLGIRCFGGVTLPVLSCHCLVSSTDMSPTNYGALGQYAFNEQCLRWTRMILQKIRQGDASTQFDILVIGDSWSQNRFRWTNPLWNLLQAEFGNAGAGWIGFSYPTGNPPLQNGAVTGSAPLTYTGSFTPTYQGTLSPDLGEITSNTPSDRIDVPFSAGQTSAKLFYIGTADGNVRYRWNGGVWNHLNLISGVGTLQVATLTAPAIMDNLFEVEVVSGTCTLCGLVLQNAANGIRIHKVASTGSRAAQWAAVTPASWNTGIASIAPKLVILMLGTNDQVFGRTAAQFSADIQTIITNIKTALGTLAVDILIAMPCENQLGNAILMSDYAAACEPVAINSQAGFVNLQYVFGNHPADYAFGSERSWFLADATHPDHLTGGRAITDALYRTLITR
jgi:hypothetical protein